jgi:hypothetical protein
MSSEPAREQGRTAEASVYRRPRWFLRILIGTLVVIGIVFTVSRPNVGAGILAFWVVIGGPLLLGNERSRVIASKDGVTSVPFIGHTTRYPWSKINWFTVGREPGGRYGGPVVSMSVSGRSVHLTPTMQRDSAHAAVQRTCDGLNADLERFTGRRPVR